MPPSGGWKKSLTAGHCFALQLNELPSGRLAKGRRFNEDSFSREIQPVCVFPRTMRKHGRLKGRNRGYDLVSCR